IDLSRVPLDDRGVYEEIQAADTVGVFQIESRAQMQSLLQTRPESLEDLTVQVALVRPGPIQGKAVHPYVKHRHAKRADPSFEPPVEHESLREPLRYTLGVVVFQDQVLDVAMAAAGFTIGEAEGLRRAMSRKRSEEAIEAWRPRFVTGCAETQCGIEDGAVRVGLAYVHSVGEDDANMIVAEQPFHDLGDLSRRAPVPKDTLEALVAAGACDEWGARRELLWRLGVTSRGES